MVFQVGEKSLVTFLQLIWPQEVTLARWTQPSGPLCLWQCLLGKSKSTQCQIVQIEVVFLFFHTALIVSFQCRYHICSICYRGTQEHVGGRSCWQRHSRQGRWQQARQQGRTRGGGVEFDSAFAKSTVAGFLRPLLKAFLFPFPQFRPPPIGVGGRLIWGLLLLCLAARSHRGLISPLNLKVQVNFGT